MADPKSPAAAQTGFLRKVAKFVANPTTDWRDLEAKDSIQREGYDKEELRAIIERRQRNDFVRKREFDMLRKIRREGLSGEGLAGLSMSYLDDSEPPQRSRDGEVKAKIDAIERQMVGEIFPSGSSASTPSSRRAALPPAGTELPAGPPLPAIDLYGQTTLPGDAVAAPTVKTPLEEALLPRLDLSAEPMHAATPASAQAVKTQGPALLPSGPGPSQFGEAFSPSVVGGLAHDPELDEAVIAFANADFEQCERSLLDMIDSKGVRALHADTWLALFDVYRATGQQQKFEALAVDYAGSFGWSAPQWFSMPKIVAEAVAKQMDAQAPRKRSGASVPVGWIAPARLDMDAVKKLRMQTLQLPLPWVLDWKAMESIEPEACGLLTQLMRVWAREPVEMHWQGGENLLRRAQDLTPTGSRDVDPNFWLLRMELLRLVNRPDEFDVAAIDYCVTYEVSPPSWEPAQCVARLMSGAPGDDGPHSSGEVSSGFVESQTHEDPSGGRIASVELSGQLVGDISGTLRALDSQLGGAKLVQVSCARLIRMDFIAAGDLLNWVLARRQEQRVVEFEDAHRMLALFFGAMGITEHAKVKTRKV